MVCPVHQAAEIIPFIHTAKLDAITHAQRHASGEVDVVRNQQRVTIGQLYDESLMTRTVIVVGQ